MSKKRVYICSSLRPEVVEHVDRLLKYGIPTSTYMDPDGGCMGNMVIRQRFYPQINTTFLRPNVQQTETFIMDCVRADVWMIDQADELWVMGQFGKDCQWEIGYAMAKGKPVKMFKDETNTHLFEESWMYRLGFDMNLLEVIDVRNQA